MSFQVVDLQNKKISPSLDALFPNWTGADEKIAVCSPHDDDAIIGAGYAMEAARLQGAELFVFIFCQGNAGYSDPNKKEEITLIRQQETIAAYEKIGVPKENIIRFNFWDFSVNQNIGWKLNNGQDGSFVAMMTAIRKYGITRVLVPNHYREHIDHTAVYDIGAWDSAQAGDPIVVDWGKPQTVKSVAEYSVWADFSPEDALANKRDVRANCLVAVSEDVEKNICDGIAEYKSQGQIIQHLIKAREERKGKNGNYGELYIVFDPRPKLNFKPYVDVMNELNV